MSKVVVAPYDSNWAKEFLRLKNYFSEVLQGIDVRIEHVGSTSVQDLAAKPILDIDIIVKDRMTLHEVISHLSKAGYEHIGDMGIKGREAFKNNNASHGIDWMKHNLYVCIEGAESLKNHLLLRDYLKNNVEAVKEYSLLKYKLAKKYPEDINAYVEGKTALITSFLTKAGMNNDELERITVANKDLS